MARPPTESELEFVRQRRVGHLGTAGSDGRPVVVPVCYAVVEHDGEPLIVTAIDEKPKSSPARRLRRVRNIEESPFVCLTVDDYSENWNVLSFVQLRGKAGLQHPGAEGHARQTEALQAKYPQYAGMALDRSLLIEISNLNAFSWRFDESPSAGLQRPQELFGLLTGRRSVRSFRSDPVPSGVVRDAIVAAGWAPSPHGQQPWRFAVVESIERRTMLAEKMADSWKAQLELDGQDDVTVAIRLAKSKQRLIDAPVLVVACLVLKGLDVYPDKLRQEAEHIMAVQSLGSAVQNMLLSIYAAGYDAGWMCAPLFCAEIVVEALGLDPDLIPQALIPIGWAAKDPVRRPRRPLDELIVQWE
jgi:PPOX class probable F420-dependent enzyme